MTANPPAVRLAPAWLVPLVALLFFASGFAALVYQVMWLRRLSLVFGVTVYAASTVLAGFMAGLAIGSYGAGRIAGRVRHPLRLFGLVELGVALTALASPLLLDGLTALYVAVQPWLPPSLAVLTVLRFAGALAVLIVPTALMGGTLPLVIQSALSRAEGFGPTAGVLYATNTAGAIAGALVGGFYLISDVGVARSFQLAAAVNVAIAVTAVAASRRLPAAEPQAESVPSSAALDGMTGSADAMVAGRMVLWASAISGLCSLALEVIWFRLLAVYLRPTAYAFTVMLAAMLSGLSLGSYLAAALLRRRGTPWLPVLTAMQALIALAAVLSFNTLAGSQAALDALVPALRSLGVDRYLWPIIASSLAAILPTAVLFGAAFPIGLRVWAGEGGEPATSRRVGTYYALNVCGAITGSILAGFVLLPALGSRGSLIAVSALILVSAILLAVRQYRTSPNFAGFVALVSPVAFAVAALATVDPFDVALERFHGGERELWRKEGVQTTVSIHERVADRMRIMYLDGNHQANDSGPTAFVHQRIGALPVMLHPAPRRVLVVGLGGGATPGAAAQFPGVEVDVVELSDAVAEGARLFERINLGLLARPNAHLRVDDGRNYLLTTRTQYDVITADIILPRHAGAGSLYSREYYQLARKALAPGGIVLQWIGGETEVEYKLQMRTFLDVFPETTLWGDGSLMAGRLTPLRFSASAYEARRQDPAFRKLFDWDLATMRRLYIAGPRALRAFVGPGPLLTDDKPVIEYFLSLPRDAPAVDLRGLSGSLDEVLVP